MDIREIQNLIKFVAKSGATEVKLEMDDFKITIKTTAEGTESTVAQPTVSDTVAAPTSDDNAKYITVKSPIIGTFYRKPAPDKPMFVEVGSTIGKGDVLCVIEAMKLFNEIESEVSGKIVKILVDDSSPVEFDQPLFLVDPS